MRGSRGILPISRLLANGELKEYTVLCLGFSSLYLATSALPAGDISETLDKSSCSGTGSVVSQWVIKEASRNERTVRLVRSSTFAGWGVGLEGSHRKYRVL